MKLFKSLTLLFAVIPASLMAQDGQKSKANKWFPKYDFNSAVFQKPPIEFDPFAPWWWPPTLVEDSACNR